MNDRLMRGIAAATLVSATALMMASAPAIAAEAAASDARVASTLATGWRFHQGDAPEAVTTPGFDDADWQSVAVPHTWNRVGFYRPDPQSHINRADTINKTQGLGWYRQRFAVPAAMRGKRIWLEFDAASRTASVWLNGTKLGDHAGGFSRFRLDATDALRASGDNVLVVRTDNSAPGGKDATTADILPLTGDFFVHGGLYRPVRLIAVDPIHIDLADFGGSGVSAATTAATAATAQVDVRTRIANASRRSGAVRITASLIDTNGRVAASLQTAQTLAAAATQEAALKLTVANPHLWHGVEDPYLYTLAVDVTDARGRLLDRVRQPFGIRTIRIDPEAGLFLNGKHV